MGAHGGIEHHGLAGALKSSCSVISVYDAHSQLKELPSTPATLEKRLKTGTLEVKKNKEERFSSPEGQADVLSFCVGFESSSLSSVLPGPLLSEKSPLQNSDSDFSAQGSCIK